MATPTLLPLTQAQLGIWFAHTLGANKALYSIGEAIEFLGPIDVGLFEQALRQVVAETDALHLRFVETGEGPRQLILAELDWTLIQVDLRSASDPRAAADAWMRDDIARAVDPSKDLLFRYALLRVAPDRLIWYTRYHHLCTDGLGASLIVRRTAARYSASIGGAAAADGGAPMDQGALLAPPPSFLRLLDADREYMQSAAYGSDREYWAGQLADRPDRVTLAGSAPVWSGEFIRRTLTVPAETCDRLRALATGCGTSLAQVFLAASAAYVHRLTGVRDLVLGMTAMIRPRGAMQRIVATTADIVPLRLSFEPGVRFELLLRQTGRRVLESLRHGRYRSEFIRRDLGLRPTDPEIYGPIVNVFSFDYDVRFGACGASARNIANWRIDDFAVGIHDRRSGGAIDIDLCANPRLYGAEALEVHRERFLLLLAGLASAPESAATPVSGIDVFLPGERERVLAGFNQTDAPAGSATPFHRRVELVAARQPHVAAVLYEGRTLSYSEIDRRANRLARLLLERGVGREDRVALCVGRSPELVVGLLGILKAGAAYVPLDPGYPRERLAHMLNDSAPAVVLTCGADADRIPPGVDCILLDAEGSLDSQPGLDPTSGAPLGAELGVADDTRLDEGPRKTAEMRSDQLAYVMYTSGSTGSPKGVMVEHGGLANYVRWAVEHYPEVSTGISVVSTSFAFDATVTSLHVPLAAGGTVMMIPEGKELESLEALLASGAPLSLVKMTPALFAALGERVQALGIECRVGLFVVGGEPLPAATVALWRRIAPGCRIVNQYGPTETVVGCTTYDASSDPLHGDSVSIGRPIWNAKIYLLDAARQPVPVGAVGEIYIGGAGVARGYLNQPALTAERFLRDPFESAPSARVYKTGDLARCRPDGNLEFLGRNDFQLKVRGFRIEPGEIEAVLRRCDLVQDAVVMAHGKGEQAQLVAYVLADRSAAPRMPDGGALAGEGTAAGERGIAATLKSQLRRSLPAFMVPAAIVALPAWPLTPNGKVDRRALAALEARASDEPPGESAATVSGRVPRSATEHRLLRIWSEVLGSRSIGIDDNFFDIGGNSLLALQVFAGILRDFGLNLPLSTLLEAPTIGALAGVLDRGGEGGAWTSLRPIRTEGSRPPLFLVPGIGGNVLCYYELARLLGSDQPVYALQSRGLDGGERPLTRVRDIARHFVRELVSVAPDGPILLGGACVGGVMAFEMAQQLAAAGRSVPLLCMFDTWPPAVHRRGPVPIHVPPVLGDLVFAAQRLRANFGALFDNRTPLRGHLRRQLRSVGQIVAHRDLYRGDKAAQAADRVTRANRWAMSMYFPRRYPGRITVFIASERRTEPRRDARLDWQRIAADGCRVHHIAAPDSGQMLEAPHVFELARLLSIELERADREGESQGPGVRGPHAAVQSEHESALRAARIAATAQTRSA